MDKIGDISAAESKVLEDVKAFLSEVRGIVEKEPESASEGVALLSQLRDVGYEELNQIQHEYLVLIAAKWLVENKHVSIDAEWYWNPRQTGGANEPDLEARKGTEIVVSAEITTSRRPIGTILERMKKTLVKLNGFNGKRFYFVRTESMKEKAEAEAKTKQQNITVVCLPHVTSEL